MTGLLVCVSTDTAADNRRIVVVFLPLSLFIAFLCFVISCVQGYLPYLGPVCD